MARICPVSIALLGLSIVCSALLLPSAAQAVCSQWDMSGEWYFVQTNNTSPKFTLRQTGTELQGSASYSHLVEDDGCIGVNCDHRETVDASVDGTIIGDSFEVTAYWNNGTIGLYTGKVGPLGRIEGNTYDKQHPQTMARWYNNPTAKCLTGAGGGSPSSVTPPVVDTKPPPVKAGARVRGPAGTVVPKSKSTVCEAAWRARERNSPAAPTLEASCAATGGTPTAPSDTVVEENPAPTSAGMGSGKPAKDEACTWRGEAPWCEGRCDAGEIRMASENDSEAPFPRAHPDFGTSCATGFKFYCCRQ